MKIPNDPVPVVVEKFDFRKIRLTSFTNRIGDLTSTTRRSTSGGGVDQRGLDNVLQALRVDGREQDADALEVLCRHHKGHHPYIDAQGNVGVTRPDKPAGNSASVGFVGPGIVKMFTSTWDSFEKNGRYVLNDAGDALVPADDEYPLPATSSATTTSTLVGTEDRGELVAGSEVFAGPDGIRYSDTGNAQRFLEQYGAHVRFVPRWGRWLVFDGGRWRIDYGDTLVAHLAGKIAMDLLGHVSEVRRDKDQLKALLRHVKRSESAQGVVATLKVAASVPGVAIDHEVLDANPWLLNVANGTLDLSKGKIRDHDPADHLTMQAAVEFAHDAIADKFLIFLEQVLPDPDVRGFVQRLAGLALVGQQLEHVLPINLGNGANGKSTLTRIMAEVLGEYAVVASRDVLLALKHDTHPTAKADLFRRRFAHSGELPPGARLDEAQVKELTGGDRIKARRMREDHWEFDPSHLLWIHANHRPSIEGTDDGIWRRVLLIPFDVQVPEADRDSRLAEKIVKTESAGVLNWMIDGLADYLENGLRVPEIVKVATTSYRNESDTVAAFLDESDLALDPALSITSNDLLAIHGDWYQSAGIGETEKAHYQRVVDDLKQHGVVLKRRGQKKIRTWLGVGEAA
jgi:putative DNA primase/helicase